MLCMMLSHHAKHKAQVSLFLELFCYVALDYHVITPVPLDRQQNACYCMLSCFTFIIQDVVPLVDWSVFLCF